MKLGRTLFVCAALLLVGGGLLWVIFSNQPVAERETAVRQSAMLVDVVAPEVGDFRPVIRALGTVRPAQEVALRPQVAGQVEWLSPRLVPGGFVKAGDPLVRIERADYQNTLLQRQSELEQAEAELELERGRREQAEREYRELQRDRNRELAPENLALVLRKPQLRSAQARVTAAQAALAQARLALDRTEVRAPFDAQVIDRNVNLGSQLTTGEPVASLVGLDEYWVEATVPLDRLRWMVFSGGDAAGASPVLIRHEGAWPKNSYREGWLDQLVGELEGATRLARVLVVVEDPLAREPAHDGQPSLIIGAFVDTQIEGREISGAFKLPRNTLRQNDTVWLMRENLLVIQTVEVAFEDADYAYITDGLTATDRVVTTNLATVKEGLRLRLRDEPLQQPVAALP